MALAKYARACAKNVAGNAAAYLAEVANVTVVLLTSGEISTMTASALAFKQIGADLDTIQRTTSITGKSNVAATHSVIHKFSKPSAALNTLRNSIIDGLPCGFLEIVQDANGTCWLVGFDEDNQFERPLNTLTDELDSGTSPTDEGMQSTTITLSSINGALAIPFNAALTATILDGSATWLDDN